MTAEQISSIMGFWVIYGGCPSQTTILGFSLSSTLPCKEIWNNIPVSPSRTLPRVVNTMHAACCIFSLGGNAGEVVTVTPLKFNSSPVKNDGWKTTFLLGR